jgi:hypothetical protein
MHATREGGFGERPQGSWRGEHDDLAAFDQVL